MNEQTNMNGRTNEESQIFTLSAVVVGFLLLQELDYKQQNDLGNWFLLLGQLLCTNAVHFGVLNPTQSNNRMTKQNMSDMLEKTVIAMQKEIAELKDIVNKTT